MRIFSKSSQWLKAIGSFWEQYRNEPEVEDTEIKLALIDDGVSTSGGEFGNSIALGWPPEPSWSNEARYYHSAREHGTKMARLIKTVCPYVKFYVAKLGAWKHETDRVDQLAKGSTATKAANVSVVTSRPPPTRRSLVDTCVVSCC